VNSQDTVTGTQSPSTSPVATPTDHDLIEALEDSFPDRRITCLARRPFERASSYAMEELRLSFDNGPDLSVVMKDLSWDRLSAKAAAAKPSFVYHPLRSIYTYERILRDIGVGPRCYASIADRSRGVYCLLLEKVDDWRLGKAGGFHIWKTVAFWLGTFHARFLDRPDDARAANPHLIDYSPAFCLLWCERAVRALEGSDDGRARKLMRLLGGYEEHAEAMGSLPSTFIHGEFYPSNVLVGAHGTGLRVCPVDWEVSATGPALLDFAALSGGKWSDEQRHGMLAAYRGGLNHAGASVPLWEEMLVQLERCRLQLALQWMGWTTSYSTPPGKGSGHDWVGEALRSLERLD
jgi:hypothetical protein